MMCMLHLCVAYVKAYYVQYFCSTPPHMKYMRRSFVHSTVIQWTAHTFTPKLYGVYHSDTIILRNGCEGYAILLEKFW